MSALKKLELFEHETIFVEGAGAGSGARGATLTEAEFLALHRFNLANGERFFTVGHRRLTTTHHVGYVEVGKLAIEILPKADKKPRHVDRRPWRDGLHEMLRVASGLRLHAPTQASQRVRESSVLELLAVRFIEEVERLQHEGLAKGYREAEANGQTFKGRLLFADQVRENAARADRFYVRYATYDRDVLVNRILYRALEALKDAAMSSATSARGTALRAAFPEVTAGRLTPDVFDRLHLGRTTTRYSDALTLARMILEHRTPQLRAGDVKVFALLFDMNALWERYVAALFRRAAPPNFVIKTQERSTFWKPQGGHGRQVKPDIVIRNQDGEVVLVVDTKWKALGAHPPADDDLRQMFVYNELFRAPRSVLAYPSVEGATAHRGIYAVRGHACDTLHLGLFDAKGWSARKMQSEVEDLFRSIGVAPRAETVIPASGRLGSRYPVTSSPGVR